MRKVTPVDMSGKTACFRRDVTITAMDETGIPRLQPWECQETRPKACLKEDIAKYLHSGLGSDFRMPADVDDSADSGLSEII